MDLKELQVVEVKGIRTLTSKQLAECYGTITWQLIEKESGDIRSLLNYLLTLCVHYNILNVYSKSEVKRMSPRTGRPKSINPKSEQIKIRATKQDKALLEECCEMTGKTQYEIVMDGIKKVYAENKK